MKIAISGKGGTGKSTLAAGLALLLARRGQRVLAVDADPATSLAAALGLSPAEQARIVPIARQTALIEERTGAKPDVYGQLFRLNPEVTGIAEKYAVTKDGVSLLVLGAVERGGSGCACAGNTLIRALVTELILHKGEALIMDMEAGVEHLGRATVSGVDTLLIVVEPGRQAVDCAERIMRMAGEIGLTRIALVANKIASPADEQFLAASFPGRSLLAWLPYSDSLKAAGQRGASVLEGMSGELITRLEALLTGLPA